MLNRNTLQAFCWLLLLATTSMSTANAYPGDDDPISILMPNGARATSLGLTRKRAERLLPTLFEYHTRFMGTPSSLLQPLAIQENLMAPGTFTSRLDLGKGVMLDVAAEEGIYTSATLSRELLPGVADLIDSPIIDLLRGQRTLVATSNEFVGGDIMWKPPTSQASLLSLFHEQGHAIRSATLSMKEEVAIADLYEMHAANARNLETLAVVTGHERDAWAQALRRLRALRRQNLDPLPDVSIKTLKQYYQPRMASYTGGHTSSTGSLGGLGEEAASVATPRRSLFLMSPVGLTMAIYGQNRTIQKVQAGLLESTGIGPVLGAVETTSRNSFHPTFLGEMDPPNPWYVVDGLSTMIGWIPTWDFPTGARTPEQQALLQLMLRGNNDDMSGEEY